MPENENALRAAETALADGQALLADGRAAEAFARLREAAALKPDDPGVLYVAAVLIHSAGRLGDADTLLARARVLGPRVPEIAFASGNLKLDQGAATAAESHFRHALVFRPDFAEARLGLARSLTAQGREPEAEAELLTIADGRHGTLAQVELATLRLRRSADRASELPLRAALAGEPSHGRALFLLADLERRRGHPAPAAIAYLRALAVEPATAAAWQGLGVILHDAAGRAALRKAAVLDPADAISWFVLAESDREASDWAAAATSLRRTLAAAPGHLEAAIHLGNALDELDRREDAAAILRAALERAPTHVMAISNLATVLLQDGAVREANRLYRQAVALDPANAVAFYNLGNARRQELDVPEALVHYGRATAIDPQYATAHWNDAVTRLMGGDWINGFARYEWRWRDRKAPLPVYAPWWRGEALDGRRILLLGEQGYGDMIHFARYALAVLERGGRVILECYPQLRRLFSTLSPHIELLELGQAPEAVDVQAALMQLPAIFGATPEQTWAPVAYLSAPAAGPRLPDARGRFKVGLVWAGNPRIEKFHKRSATLDDFAPLLEMPDVAAYSLQVGSRASDIGTLGHSDRIDDLAPLIGDFADTASLLTQLDLLVAVDTAVAHLAGALGRPVWMMPTYVPDWRWLLGRSDTPWYPTMRLYRQSEDRTWKPVLAQIARDIAVEIEARRRTARREPDGPVGR